MARHAAPIAVEVERESCGVRSQDGRRSEAQLVEPRNRDGDRARSPAGREPLPRACSREYERAGGLAVSKWEWRPRRPAVVLLGQWRGGSVREWLEPGDMERLWRHDD